MATQLSREDVVLFAEQLAALVRTELPLAPAIREVGQNLSRARGRAAIEVLATELDKGVKLSDALAGQPNNFPPLFVALVAAGEKSGRLADVLGELAHLAQMRYRFRRAIVDALAYPLFVLLFALTLTCTLLLTLSQQVIDVIRDFAGEAQMPPLARAAAYTTEHLLPLGVVVTILLSLLLVAWLALSLGAQGRKFLSRVSFALPLWGAVAKNFALAHWARLMSLLVKHGVPLHDALSLTSGASTNVVLAEATAASAAAVSRGETLTEALKPHRQFPQLLLWHILSGEQQNQLAAALAHAADTYDERAESATRFMERSLQPILIVLIGSLVAAVIVLVLAPLSVLVSSLFSSMSF